MGAVSLAYFRTGCADHQLRYILGCLSAESTIFKLFEGEVNRSWLAVHIFHLISCDLAVVLRAMSYTICGFDKVLDLFRDRLD